MGIFVITRKDRIFFHFGILLNSGRVLHFASKTNNMFAHDQTVKDDSLAQFSLQRKTKIMYQIYDIDDQTIQKRAKEYWGMNVKYSLQHNNCITFVLSCLYDEVNFCFWKVLNYYMKCIVMK